MSIVDNATVFKFVLHFDSDCRSEDRQERYVIAMSENEAIEKFDAYLQKQAAKGFQMPYCYSFYPTVELQNAIM